MSLGDADEVICLIGFRRGAEPFNRPADQARRSRTQMEFDFAESEGKPVYVFLAQDSCSFDPHDPEPDELRGSQLEHRRRIKSRNKPYYSFRDAPGLIDQIRQIRFPQPQPDRKPNNLGIASIGSLFKGREDALHALRDQFLSARGSHAQAIVAKHAIHGLGGVGKTRLAVEYAWRFQSNYSALLMISASTPEVMRSNLAALIPTLQIPADPATPQDEQVRLVMEWFDSRADWLLIVDNVDDGAAARAVEDQWSQPRQGHVLITSRIANWGVDIASFEINALAEPDAIDFLLARTANRRQPTRPTPNIWRKSSAA